MIYSIESHPLFELYTKTCVTIEPLILAISSYLIIEFFPRVACEYRTIHPTARQKSNKFNLLITILPFIACILTMGLIKQQKITAVLFTFSFISIGIFSIFPVFVIKKNLSYGSLFGIMVYLTAMYYYNYKFILGFIPAIAIGLIYFRHESKIEVAIRRVLSFVLLFGYIGLSFSITHKSQLASAIASYVGCFFAFLFSKQQPDKEHLKNNK